MSPPPATTRWSRLFGWLNDSADPHWERPGPSATQTRRDVLGATLFAIVALTVSVAAQSAGAVYEAERPWKAYLAVGLMTVPLLTRRRYPIASLAAATVLFISLTYVSTSAAISIPFQVAYFTTLYSAVAWARDRRMLWIATAFVLGAMTLWITISLTLAGTSQVIGSAKNADGPLPPLIGYAYFILVINLAYFGGAALIGRAAWRTALDRVRVREQADQIAAQAEQLARRAVVDERVRIARELHDVVAHHVSVIGVQASAARRVLNTSPELSAQALHTIEGASREVVREMRSLLRVLRSDDATPQNREPEPGLGNLDALASGLSETGLAVDIERIEARPGDIERLSAPLSLSAYRCIQESLTNVRTHSTAMRASVTVRTGGAPATSWLEVEIVDAGRPRLNTSGTGFGLRGIGERAQLHHGELEAGPRNLGNGWRVRVRFPYREATGAPQEGEQR